MGLEHLNLLVPYTESNQEKTFKWVTNPELSHLMNYPKTISAEEHKKWYARIIKQHIFAIVTEGIHIGNCCLKNHDSISKRAELWIYIGEKTFRGKGLGRAALQELLDYGFQHLKLNKIFLYFLDNNIVAERLYTKCGFQYEGKLRSHHYINGEYRNAIFMGILREEWNY